MTLHDYQDTHGLSNGAMCRLLNENRTSATDQPIFEHRLQRLKDGQSRPRGHEIQALLAATDEEVDRYKS